MDPNTIKKISAQIYRRFPEVTGVQPKVRSQPPGPAETRPPSSKRYLLIYHVLGSGPGGITLPRWVRVTADPEGRIIKISTSH
jgi:hypothetical protein